MKSRELHISVLRSDAYARARIKASYSAGKSIPTMGNAAYDQIQIADADSILVDKYWNEACAAGSAVIDDYADYTNTDVTEYSATLRMPMNYDTRKESVIAEKFSEYIINAVLARWFNDTVQEKAEYYEGKSADILASIESLLASRLRPMRKRGCSCVEFEEGGQL